MTKTLITLLLLAGVLYAKNVYTLNYKRIDTGKLAITCVNGRAKAYIMGDTLVVVCAQ